MKKMTITIIIALSAGIVHMPTAWGEMVTVEEALTLAENWIDVIMEGKGHWGDSDWAQAGDIQEFKRDGLVIGYFCRVDPIGFIVISLRKELAPVKAYSATCDLDPQSNEGMADLLKTKMERILDAIERPIRLDGVDATPDVRDLLEIDYRPAWDALGRKVEVSTLGLKSGIVAMNYAGGIPPLLSSKWHQKDPYNRRCPSPPAGDDCTWPNCQVGCIPLVGAQVMRYWAWPPERPDGGTYDWPNMPDAVTGPLFKAQQVDAVATLCYDVGVKCGADYCEGDCKKGKPCACSTSACFASCWGRDLLDAFEDHFWYSEAADDYDRAFLKPIYSAVEWFNLIKNELNANRPIPYRVKDHGIVCDGWEEYSLRSSPCTNTNYRYHMNYGWGETSSNTWYCLDALPLGGENVERMLLDIYPAPAIGHTVSGYYPPSGYSHHRYFDRDAMGNSATFEQGQNLQFLPGIKVTRRNTPGSPIRFIGTDSDNTRLFSIKGTATGGKVAEAWIYDGEIRLYQRGSVRFH